MANPWGAEFGKELVEGIKDCVDRRLAELERRIADLDGGGRQPTTRSADRIIQDQLWRDADFIRKHGGTEAEVASFVAMKRADYEEAVSTALAHAMTPEMPSIPMPASALH